MCWDPNGRYWTERGDGISIWRSDKTPVWKEFSSKCKGSSRRVVEESLRSISEQSESYDEMLSILEERARVSRTGKLWVNCLVQPVLIMMLFI